MDTSDFFAHDQYYFNTYAVAQSSTSREDTTTLTMGLCVRHYALHCRTDESDLHQLVIRLVHIRFPGAIAFIYHLQLYTIYYFRDTHLMQIY
jgi:hypothetical protein